MRGERARQQDLLPSDGEHAHMVGMSLKAMVGPAIGIEARYYQRVARAAAAAAGG